jgi:hypothetical protein
MGKRWATAVDVKISMSLKNLAGTTGLEPATSAVTGQRSNQLNYVPAMKTQLVTSNTLVLY